MDVREVITEEAASNPAFRQKVSDGLDLNGLLSHPGWLALKSHFENGKEGYGKALTATLLSGAEVSQRDIDYMRGCREMAEAIFKYPELALANLERTAERLLQRKFEEDATEHEAESFYIDPEVT